MGSSNARDPRFAYLLQAALLVLLTVQTSSHMLMTRYCRGVRGERYNISVGILVTEVLKFMVCLLVLILQRLRRGGVSDNDKTGANEDLGTLVRSSYLVLPPTVLYFLQNWMIVLAIENLSSGLFTVLNQLKVLTTAIISVVMLGTSLSPRRWRALLLLVCGVSSILLTSSKEDAATAKTVGKDGNPQSGNGMSGFILGLTMVMGVVWCSGFSGVYFERVLKRSTGVSLWARNMQMAAFSIILCASKIAFSEMDGIQKSGWFHDWSIFTVMSQLISAVGGILVAAVTQYANSIVKGFATSIAIVLNSVVSWYLFQEQLNNLFWIGATVVIISLFNYAEPEQSPTTTATTATATAMVAKVEHCSDCTGKCAQLLQLQKRKAD